MCWFFGRVVCPIGHKGTTLLDEVRSGVSSLGLIPLIVSQSQLLASDDAFMEDESQ